MSPIIPITVIFVLLYLGFSAYIMRGLRLTTRDLCVSGVLIALTLVLDSIRIPLPTGATFPLLSPVPLLAMALLWDHRLAILSGFLFGVLAMFLIPVWAPVHWGQIFTEHLICVSCYGYAGIFGTDKRWKALCGVILASAIKVVGHTISGVLFFSQNAWDGWGAWGYSLTYNITQNVPLCILSGLIVLSLPIHTIRRAIGKEKV